MASTPCESPLTLTKTDNAEVLRILCTCVPQHTVWAFGSRVNGTAKPYSDLDLVILTKQPLSLESLATLNEAFDESDLPFRVDIVDWAATSATFQQIILRNHVVIQQGSDPAENITSSDSDASS